MDAAFAFLTNQLEYVESQIFSVEYAPVDYAKVMPVSNEAGEWATSIAYHTIDRVGMAKWIAADANDIPMVDVSMSKTEVPVALGGVGYGYNLDEIRKAQKTGQNLPTMKAQAAREAYEEHADEVGYLGDTAKQIPGFLTNSLVPKADAINGAGGSFRWTLKTADEILFDINDALTSVYTTTKNRHIPARVGLPPSLFALITSLRIGTDANMTLFKYARENNIYTATTGTMLEIIPIRRLEAFPDGGGATSRRMVVYTATTDVMVYHIPMPLRFYPPQATGYNFNVPGDYKLGGCEIRKPITMKFIKIDNAL